MKILRLYLSLPPKPGGMEKHIYFLTKHQKKNHATTMFFNTGRKLDYKDKQFLSFIQLHKLKPNSLGVLIFYFAVTFYLAVNRKKFDIIHIHGDWSSIIFGPLIKFQTSAKLLVFTVHGEISKSLVHQKILPRILKNVSLIFSTGYKSAKELSRLTDKPVIFQPSGIDKVYKSAKPAFEKDDNFKVLTVANLVKVKNIPFLLRIAKEMKDIEFFIIGDGPEKKDLQDKIDKELLYNVHLLGFKSPNELVEIYRRSQCFLLSSLAEGTPTSVLEAMACGLPIISSNAGGIKKIIKDGVNGFVITNFNEFLYADKIRFLQRNEAIRRRISLNNSKSSLNFSWNHVEKTITGQIENLYYQQRPQEQ